MFGNKDVFCTPLERRPDWKLFRQKRHRNDLFNVSIPALRYMVSIVERIFEALNIDDEDIIVDNKEIDFAPEINDGILRENVKIGVFHDDFLFPGDHRTLSVF
jgi:hypothetical protein